MYLKFVLPLEQLQISEIKVMSINNSFKYIYFKIHLFQALFDAIAALTLNHESVAAGDVEDPHNEDIDMEDVDFADTSPEEAVIGFLIIVVVDFVTQ